MRNSHTAPSVIIYTSQNIVTSQYKMKVSEAYSGFLEAEDIPEGKEITVTIEMVRQPNGKDKGLDGQKVDKPIVKLAKVKKEWVLNKTNARLIRRQYGNDMNKWAGQSVKIYRTTCRAFGKTVACIRVKDESVNQEVSMPSSPFGNERGGQ